MPQIQQSVDLGQVAVEAACEFRFAYLGGSHLGIECQFGFRQRRQCHEWPSASSTGFRNITAKINVAHEGRLNSVRSTQQRFFTILTESMCFRNIRSVNQYGIVGVLGELNWIAQHDLDSSLPTLVRDLS